MEIEMENGPKLDRGKNDQKMAQKWKIMENSLKNPFFGHFFAIFAAFQLGPFSISISIFFSISGFWPFSMPCQPGRIPKLGGQLLKIPPKASQIETPKTHEQRLTGTNDPCDDPCEVTKKGALNPYISTKTLKIAFKAFSPRRCLFFTQT